MKTRVLVTGANGQLGKSLLKVSLNYSTVNFTFLNRAQLDVTNPSIINKYLEKNIFHFIVNTSAYTTVDLAETEKEEAFKINTLGVSNLVKASNTFNIKLIHISTDFVFDGTKNTPYKEDDNTNPLSVYGQTKYDGEQEIINNKTNYYIVRTSWLYSEFGKNFLKSMINLSKNRDKIDVVYDQIGTPTYAIDLALVLIKIIRKGPEFGIYHYSNQGVASWYDFAKTIFEYTNNPIETLPIKTTSYPTPAKRPTYSVLDKNKIEKTLSIKVPYWRESLLRCLKDVF